MSHKKPSKADAIRRMFASMEWHSEGGTRTSSKAFSYDAFKRFGLYACAYVGDVQYACSIFRKMGYKTLVGDWAVYVYDMPPKKRT